mmetsp:Transcript_38206/g.101462  ORF Transcript_38206/g.101462 Transcript_38206/m.101462 type:complete len:109 (+) Transcript_38206:90-416(+)
MLSVLSAPLGIGGDTFTVAYCLRAVRLAEAGPMMTAASICVIGPEQRTFDLGAAGGGSGFLGAGGVGGVGGFGGVGGVGLGSRRKRNLMGVKSTLAASKDLSTSSQAF